MPCPLRYSQIAWVIAWICAALKDPLSAEPRCPLVPKATSWEGSAGSGVRLKNSLPSRAGSISNDFGAGLPASGERATVHLQGVERTAIVPLARPARADY